MLREAIGVKGIWWKVTWEAKMDEMNGKEERWNRRSPAAEMGSREWEISSLFLLDCGRVIKTF